MCLFAGDRQYEWDTTGINVGSSYSMIWIIESNVISATKLSKVGL